MILFLKAYPLSPKIKPIHQVYANVSELPPPPPKECLEKQLPVGIKITHASTKKFVLHPYNKSAITIYFLG